MSKPKPHVWIVHECATLVDVTMCKDNFYRVIKEKEHIIHGVYANKGLAERHRNKLVDDFNVKGYVCMTKHALRGGMWWAENGLIQVIQ